MSKLRRILDNCKWFQGKNYYFAEIRDFEAERKNNLEIEAKNNTEADTGFGEEAPIENHTEVKIEIEPEIGDKTKLQTQAELRPETEASNDESGTKFQLHSDPRDETETTAVA